MTLKELFKKELPINRKERYYTGTIFPMIVCRDNFKYFNKFLGLIDEKLEKIKIKYDNEDTNIQFFTEYCLKEALINREEAETFTVKPDDKQTPDIIILINDGKEKYLIVIEAKMYVNEARAKVKDQMNKQKSKVINSIKERSNIKDEKIYHLALFPKDFKEIKHFNEYSKEFPYKIITWEQVYDIYKNIYQNDYFLNILKIALDNYSERVSRNSGEFGKNKEDDWSGEEIYNSYKQAIDKGKECKMKSMGRRGGLNGKDLANDLLNDKWKKQQYEVSSRKLHKQNWFCIDDFIKKIDKNKD